MGLSQRITAFATTASALLAGCSSDLAVYSEPQAATADAQSFDASLFRRLSGDAHSDIDRQLQGDTAETSAETSTQIASAACKASKQILTHCPNSDLINEGDGNAMIQLAVKDATAFITDVQKALAEGKLIHQGTYPDSLAAVPGAFFTDGPEKTYTLSMSKWVTDKTVISDPQPHFQYNLSASMDANQPDHHFLGVNFQTYIDQAGKMQLYSASFSREYPRCGNGGFREEITQIYAQNPAGSIYPPYITKVLIWWPDVPSSDCVSTPFAQTCKDTPYSVDCSKVAPAGSIQLFRTESLSKASAQLAVQQIAASLPSLFEKYGIPVD